MRTAEESKAARTGFGPAQSGHIVLPQGLLLRIGLPFLDEEVGLAGVDTGGGVHAAPSKTRVPRTTDRTTVLTFGQSKYGMPWKARWTRAEHHRPCHPSGGAWLRHRLPPPIAVSQEIGRGTLVPLLEAYVRPTGGFAALWPTSRRLSRKLRIFVDFQAAHLRIGDCRRSILVRPPSTPPHQERKRPPGNRAASSYSRLIVCGTSEAQSGSLGGPSTPGGAPVGAILLVSGQT